MKFVGAWGGYTVLQDEKGNFVVEETGKVLGPDKNEAFHKCMIGAVYD